MKKLFVYMAIAIFGAIGAVTAQQSDIALEDIWTKRTFSPQGIGAIRSMNDGEHYCTMSRTGIAKYNYATGEKVDNICVFGGPAMQKKARPLPPFENYQFSGDESKILLSSGFEPIYRHSGISDYYLYDCLAKTFTKLSSNGKQRLTTFSPDGTKVAFVRDNNIYYIDLATLEEHQITKDGKLNEIIYGTTDWVYEEEFAITQGFKWSPDSKRIAFYRFDESKVKQYTMQMWGELYPEEYTYKYPKAGEDNSKVEIWLYDIDNNKISKPELGSDNDQYLPRFQWTKNPELLAVMRMNRLQNNLELLTVDVSTLDVATLYEEQSDTYVDVPDTWKFLNDGKQFIITSEKDGYRHIYLYGMDGKLVKQVTTGDWEVVEVCGIDERNKKIYYTSHESGAINTDLYVIGFNGKRKECLNHKGTSDLGNKIMHDNGIHCFSNGYLLGSYGAGFSEGCKYYICYYSDANTPFVYTLHNAKGKLVKVLQDNAPLVNKMEQYGTRNKKFGTFITSNDTKLNYYTILPPDFDSTKKYPLLFYVYGGPGNQQVTNSYGYSDYYWFHMLAQKGYIVACFDGRGTGGRGAQFKKQTYLNLGHMECEDAIEAAKWFGKQAWIDESRIGIFGWSFGGYLSTLSILKGNDVFKSAIAVAPVMNWRYYDNIYTERFLGLPKDNAKGYDENSPLNFAELLKGNYLLVHGTGDDNVHFQNSAEMIDKLENAEKNFELRIYPNKNHFIMDATGNTRLNLYKLMTDFILRKL